MSPTLLLISHQNLTLNLGSWLWKCFFKSNDAFNAETKIIQSFCEIDSESKSWWFVFWLKIKPYSTILFHWKITVSLCGSSKSCRVTVNGNDSLNKSRDNEFHILSNNGKFNWKLIVLGLFLISNPFQSLRYSSTVWAVKDVSKLKVANLAFSMMLMSWLSWNTRNVFHLNGEILMDFQSLRISQTDRSADLSFPCVKNK